MLHIHTFLNQATKYEMETENFTQEAFKNLYGQFKTHKTAIVGHDEFLRMSEEKKVK